MICWFTLLARRYLLYNKLFFNQFDYKASISWFLSFKKNFFYVTLLVTSVGFDNLSHNMRIITKKDLDRLWTWATHLWCVGPEP
jgi:hypothetical protein